MVGISMMLELVVVVIVETEYFQGYLGRFTTELLLDRAASLS